MHSVRPQESGEWTWNYDPAIESLLREQHDTAERWESLSKITAPTLLVRGEDSDITSAEIYDEMQQRIPDSRIAEIPEAGHRVSGDNPLAFNASLREFLVGVNRTVDGG